MEELLNQEEKNRAKKTIMETQDHVIANLKDAGITVTKEKPSL